MNNPSMGAVERIRQDSWLQTAFLFLRENLTTSNLAGLMGGICAIALLLAPLPEQWNIRLPLYFIIFVWTILRPRVALYLMPFAVPWGSLDIINIRGLNLNSADVLVVFLSLGWLMSFALRSLQTYGRWGSYVLGPRDREASHIPPYFLFAILGLLAAMLLSMAVAININSSLKEIAKWLEFLALVLLGSQYIRTRRQVWTIIVLVCLSGISLAFYGYVQAFFDLGPQAFIRDTSLRVYGTFGQPNPYAGFINLPLSIALALMILGSNWRTRILGGLAVIFLGEAEYLSQSKGGYLALAAALLFIVIVGIPRIRKPMVVAALAALGLIEIFFAGWIPAYVLNPLYKFLGVAGISLTNPGSTDFSTAERLAHWIAGVHMFLNHPLLGVGIGNYPDAYAGYYITIFVNSLGHAHNYYINITAETGAIGLTAYLLFLMALFVAGGNSFLAISKKYMQARAQSEPSRAIDVLDERKGIASLPGKLSHIHQRGFYSILGGNRLALYVQSLMSTLEYRIQATSEWAKTLRNDRALAIGLLAALITICVHNLVDNLYVHSLTNLIALLLIVLIRLEGVTTKAVGNGG